MASSTRRRARNARSTPQARCSRRADRLPHPPRLRRPPRARVRDAPAGRSYEEIARAGGGIVSTVKLTREAVTADLYAQSARRALQQLMAHGVTTVEVKSGYGLSLKDELRVPARRARTRRAPAAHRARATLLAGAHALPPEYAGRSDDYIACRRAHRSRGSRGAWPMRSTPSARTSPSTCCRRARCSRPRSAPAADEAACRAAEQHAWRALAAEFDAPRPTTSSMSTKPA